MSVLLKMFLHFREIVLGEHTILQNPDCYRTPDGQKKCLAPIFKRKPAEIIVHEENDKNNPTSTSDIALIRVDKLMPLFT